VGNTVELLLMYRNLCIGDVGSLTVIVSSCQVLALLSPVVKGGILSPRDLLIRGQLSRSLSLVEQ
jgi:hypothetical protein